jgi:hypothetical protein
MTTIPDDPEALLTARQLSAALTQAGYRIATATLNTRVSRGGGPPYQKWNVTRLYRWGTALQWAQGCLSRPVRTTAELRRSPSTSR